MKKLVIDKYNIVNVLSFSCSKIWQSIQRNDFSFLIYILSLAMQSWEVLSIGFWSFFLVICLEWYFFFFFEVFLKLVIKCVLNFSHGFPNFSKTSRTKISLLAFPRFCQVKEKKRKEKVSFSLGRVSYTATPMTSTPPFLFF